MIKIFKLTNGNEIIGEITDEELTLNEYYNIINPMLIIGADDDYGYGGMRLRDALLLSDDDFMTIPAKHCMMYYSPSRVFVEYYQLANKHYKTNTKRDIEQQIKEATTELGQYMNDRTVDPRKARSLDRIMDILSELEEPKGKLN